MENLNIPNLRKLAELTDQPIGELLERLDKDLGEQEQFKMTIVMLEIFNKLGVDPVDDIISTNTLKGEDMDD